MHFLLVPDTVFLPNSIFFIIIILFVIYLSKNIYSEYSFLGVIINFFLPLEWLSGLERSRLQLISSTRFRICMLMPEDECVLQNFRDYKSSGVKSR